MIGDGSLCRKVNQKIDWIRNKPFLSTSLAAIMLAGFWIFSWLIVFFGSLFFLTESETTIYGLFIGMWLSTSIEALIRWFEHTPFSTLFSQPHLPARFEGDEKDYPGTKAVLFFLIGILITFFIGYSVSRGWLSFDDLSFKGIPQDGLPSKSISTWKEILLNDITQYAILACFTLRFLIYKRSHKMTEQQIKNKENQ